MNKEKYLLLTIAIGMMLLISSCKKSFYTDANINKNVPPYVAPRDLLPPIEVNIGNNQGGNLGISYFTSLFTQQTAGITTAAIQYYNYTFTETNFESSWSGCYISCMENCKNYIQVSDAGNYYGHSGIGRILLAYELQTTVDCWGNIPYSQAFQGTANINAKYDTDVSVYTTITQLVYDGINKLNQNAQSLAGNQPGAEDFIYKGNMAEWIKFGNAILARIFIHQSKGNAAMADSAMAHASLSFAGNADNARLVYTSPTTFCPWYNTAIGHTLYYAYLNYPTPTTFGGMLSSSNDPRYSVLIDSIAEVNTQNGLAAYYGSQSSPIEFITYDEMQYVIAEANIRISNSVNAAAQTAFANALNANMSKFGIAFPADSSYLAQHGTITGATVAGALDSIGYQEYISLYLNPEAWTSWRRFGYPVLNPAAGTNGVPRRFLYPQTEYSYNSANTPASTLWLPKLFWDN
jgi:hypothetical protein